MLGIKRILGIALAIAVAASQASVAVAAPQLDPLIGTIDSISEGTDSGGNTIIIVNYTDTDGNAQTAELSVADAEALGLISVDPNTGDITILATAGTAIDITEVAVDPCALPEGADQPVGEALTTFFCGALDVDYDTIAGWHEDGYGFGVITQALFMAQTLGGDMALAEEILLAKTSGLYDGLGLPEDADVNNWGQLKKYVMSEEVKSLTNLGAIMSGRAEPLVIETPTGDTTVTTITTTTSSTTTLLGMGNGKGGRHGNSGDHGKGKGKGH
jgi:hypothetical protein